MGRFSGAAFEPAELAPAVIEGTKEPSIRQIYCEHCDGLKPLLESGRESVPGTSLVSQK